MDYNYTFKFEIISRSIHRTPSRPVINRSYLVMHYRAGQTANVSARVSCCLTDQFAQSASVRTSLRRGTARTAGGRSASCARRGRQALSRHSPKCAFELSLSAPIVYLGSMQPFRLPGMYSSEADNGKWPLLKYSSIQATSVTGSAHMLLFPECLSIDQACKNSDIS